MSCFGRNFRIDPHTRRLHVEALEDRRMLATFSVTNLLDGPVTAAGDLPGSLRQAIFDANNSGGADEIDLSSVSGTLLMTEGEFEITEALTISGPGMNVLTIDAGNGQDGLFATADGFRVFNIDNGLNGVFEYVEIRGVTISGGDSTDGQGGGIRSLEHLTLSESRVSGNATLDGISSGTGAGVFAYLGDLKVYKSFISNNAMQGENFGQLRGGGIFSDSNRLTIELSTISENVLRAKDDSDSPVDAYGAGIYSLRGSVAIAESEISNNQALGRTGFGGGIQLGASQSTIRETRITGNKSGSDDSYGAGLHVSFGNLFVEDAYVADNVGSGVYLYSVDAVIERSLVTGNTGTFGGGIHAFHGYARPTLIEIRNSTISDNTATRWGGGFINTGGNTLIEHSTITNNVAPSGQGSGISSWGSTAETSIRNSVVAGNGNDDVAIFDTSLSEPQNTIVSGGYNLIGTGTDFDSGLQNSLDNFTAVGDQTGIIDPLLGPLQDNGGPTFTHALMPGSPALDAGDPNFASPPDYDQRGSSFHRVMNGRIDIGAFESRERLELPGDFNGDHVVDALDFLYWQINGGNLALWQQQYGMIEAMESPSLTVTTELDVVDPYDDFTSLREAVAHANELQGADTIEFDASLANGTIWLTEGEIQITDDLTINGLGQDLLTINAGNGEDGEFGTLDGWRIFLVSTPRGANSATDLTLYGLTLTGADGGSGAIANFGNVTIESSTISDNYALEGGALISYSGTVQFVDSIVRNNGSFYFGGGIVAQRTDLIISSSVISNNAAIDWGGGIYVIRGTLEITDSTVEHNSTSSGGADGGGVFASSSSVIVNNSEISQNATTVSFDANGGGLAIFGGSLEIYDSTISGNSTFGDGADGGGVYTTNSDVTIVRTQVTGNYTNGAFADGGGLFLRESNVLIQDSTVSDNSALFINNIDERPSTGGGISVSPNPNQLAQIINSTISGNFVADGGGAGLFVYDGTAHVLNSTITGNEAPEGNGSGIASNSREGTTTNVINSIVSGNVNSDVDIFKYTSSDPEFNSFVSGGYNLIGTGSDFDSGNQNSLDNFSAPGDQTGVLNPLLGPLQDNGGPTLTHALLPGSPAIDSGDPAFDPLDPDGDPLTDDALPYDQRGEYFDRVDNGRIDIGAYESQPLAGDFNGDQVVNGLDFLYWQINGGDLAAWEAQYGLSEPVVSVVSSAAEFSSAEEVPAPVQEPEKDYWVSLPEKLTATQPTQSFSKLAEIEHVDQAFTIEPVLADSPDDQFDPVLRAFEDAEEESTGEEAFDEALLTIFN